MNDDALLIVAALVAVYFIVTATGDDGGDDSGDPQGEGIGDSIITLYDETAGNFTDTPLADMTTSQAGLNWLRGRENCRLTRYALGDGGYTWGWGHFDKNPNALPMTISQDQADSIFADDVINRGEKWVKLYVTTPLSQNQFDALVSIAYNMSPQSFKKFAASVNAGQGIDGIADASVAWVSANLQNGIRNRRESEKQVFNQGVYS